MWDLIVTIISMSEALQVMSVLANVVFITWGVVSMFRERKHRREMSNIFSAEYKSTSDLANATKDENVKLQIEHIAEFLKAFTRSLSNKRHDHVGGEHHNFFMRWLHKKFSKKTSNKKEDKEDK